MTVTVAGRYTLSSYFSQGQDDKHPGLFDCLYTYLGSGYTAALIER